MQAMMSTRQDTSLLSVGLSFTVLTGSCPCLLTYPIVDGPTLAVWSEIELTEVI